MLNFQIQSIYLKIHTASRTLQTTIPVAHTDVHNLTICTTTSHITLRTKLSDFNNLLYSDSSWKSKYKNIQDSVTWIWPYLLLP